MIASVTTVVVTLLVIVFSIVIVVVLICRFSIVNYFHRLIGLMVIDITIASTIVTAVVTVIDHKT